MTTKKKPSSKAKKTAPAKILYHFGGGKADGDTTMKNLLGGKGANLAEMAGLGLPVPPGFTVTTDVCTYYYAHDKTYPKTIDADVLDGLKRMEKIVGTRFGDARNPLLLSVRSGARTSMPGMMETILNVGLNDTTREGLIEKTGNPRFVYDAQRRLMQMYSDVVMEKAEGIEPAEGKGIRHQLEAEMKKLKKSRKVTEDTDLDGDDLKALVDTYRRTILRVLGKPFPEDPMEQLWGAIGAVFRSWNGKRAIDYRRIERIPGEWGTAVNVQAMVFGNLGETSGTGVGFTRDPSSGRKIFYGEWLPNAQGEDVVAGIRTPLPINEEGKGTHNRDLASLETAMPVVYKALVKVQKSLEKHYRDMLDIEFTIQDGRLWMLQCRAGKRTGRAAVKMAVDMAKERLINKREAVMRVPPASLIQFLLPAIDRKAEALVTPIARGLPAGPGGAAGRIVLTADEAVSVREKGLRDAAAARAKGDLKKAEQFENDARVLLVREETSPEDIHGMHAAEAILTARGGMTSHAALVARGWGKCCVVGCDAIEINLAKGVVQIGDQRLKRGDWITLNGTEGKVYGVELPLVDPDPKGDDAYKDLMGWADQFRRLGVRTNADTPTDARRAIAFGAEGIGLFRTEHMFYGEGGDVPLELLREMIVAADEKERKKALGRLAKHVKSDVKKTLQVMDGMPVTIRLLDPPLHEFIPHSESGLKALAKKLGIKFEELSRRAAALQESNPMMGHRGVRLGVSYPEITAMQVRAIFEAAAELRKAGKKPLPEIMIPVVSTPAELANQYAVIDEVYQEVLKKTKRTSIPHQVGTMIEIPRAALVADKIAEHAEFFSFGTNDLTQMTFGFSRDDTGGFLPAYVENKILPGDPFESLDQEAVGELVKIGIERGRSTKPGLKIGICGEHGGDPASVEFCHRVGMDYVSCSPFRVPVARLSAAQAALREE